MKIVSTAIRHGYTGHDHLIDSVDKSIVASFVGREFPTYAAACRAVQSAFLDSCDHRVSTARIDVTCSTRSGYRGPDAGYFIAADNERANNLDTSTEAVS